MFTQCFNRTLYAAWISFISLNGGPSDFEYNFFRSTQSKWQIYCALRQRHIDVNWILGHRFLCCLIKSHPTFIYFCSERHSGAYQICLRLTMNRDSWPEHWLVHRLQHIWLMCLTHDNRLFEHDQILYALIYLVNFSWHILKPPSWWCSTRRAPWCFSFHPIHNVGTTNTWRLLCDAFSIFNFIDT